MNQTVAGRYVLESEISRGGMATVWRARDDVLARRVAIKILHPHLSEDEGFVERFRREALAAARLSHPNIVSIYDTGTDVPEGGGPNLQYIVMEYCGGGTLAHLAAESGPLPPERVVAIGDAACDALAFAHHQGIVHRDVKPANVLMADDGHLKVADFGIAKAAFVKGDITTTGSILGTVTYISPEQAQGLEPDHRSDLYSLGAVLYELTVGRPPFEGETQIATAMKHLKEPPAAPRSIDPRIPQPLETVILRALEKDPERRFASADEMRSALDGASSSGGTMALPLQSPPPVATSPSGTRSAWRPGWMMRVVAAIVATIALAVVASTLINISQEDPPAEENRRRNRGRATAAPGGGQVEVASVTDFDPHGGDGEHPEEAPNATDGDPSTVWTTQTYSSLLSAIKPGVGLLFDLGDSREVSSVSIVGSSGMDFDLRAADSCGADETAFEVVAEERAFPGETDLEFEPTSGRCWILWITKLSAAGGGRAEVAEVEFSGA
jgi:eukaryotic-like serine/threonine-protein kinase